MHSVKLDSFRLFFFCAHSSTPTSFHPLCIVEVLIIYSFNIRHVLCSVRRLVLDFTVSKSPVVLVMCVCTGQLIR